MKKQTATKAASTATASTQSATEPLHLEPSDLSYSPDPGANNLHGKAAAEGRTRANQTITNRLAAQYNSLTPTQKMIGGALLTASALGTAYLTRNSWIPKSKQTASSKATTEERKRAEAKKIDL